MPAKKSTANPRKKTVTRSKTKVVSGSVRNNKRSFTMPALFAAAFAMIGVVTLLMTHAATPTNSGPVGIFVGIGNKCMNLQNNTHSTGIPVTLWHCNGNPEQDWTLQNDGTIRNQGWCLNIPNNSKVAATALALNVCTGAAGQKWAVQTNSSITNPNSGFCLDDRSSGTTDGNPLQIYPCNGTAAQKWVVPNTATKPDAAPNPHAVLPGGVRHTPQPTVELDAAQAPDLLPWMQTRLRPLLQQWYPVFGDTFAYPSYQPASMFTVKLDATNTGVAYTSNSLIDVNPTWLRAHLGEAVGAVMHETIHTIQYTGGKPNMHSWEIEGMADYAREHIYQDRAPRAANTNETYLNGYSPAANLLSYAQTTYAASFIHDMNVASWNGAYSDSIFTQRTGRTVGQLWTAMTGRYASSPATITNGTSGKCIDIPNYVTAAGTRPKIQTCNGSDAENWALFGTTASSTNFSIAGYNGICLDVASSGTADGSPVQEWGCNLTGAQLWHKGANGSIVNNNAGKCLQPIGAADVNNTLLEIVTCNNSTAQRWTVPQ